MDKKRFSESNTYIGWAIKSITPDQPVALAGQFYKRISKYVHDPIYVTVMAIEVKNKEGNKEQLIIATCDLVSIDKNLQDKVRERIYKINSDLDVKKLFLCAIHTHTAPVISKENTFKGRLGDLFPRDKLEIEQIDEECMQPDEYYEFLINRISEAVVYAWKNRKPGGVSRQLAHAVVGHNRRIVYDDESAKMYGNTDTSDFHSLEGPSDHGIELLYCWNLEGKLTGVAVNVACPSQVVENKRYISADYWSEVRKELKKRYEKDIYVLPLCGASGDQSPRDLIRKGKGEPSMHDEEGMVEIGKRIADAVESKCKKAKERICINPIMSHNVCDINLPIRTVTKEQAKKAQHTVDDYLCKLNPDEKINDIHIQELFVPLGILKRYKEQRIKNFYNMELHVIRIGDIAMATNPFELFINYGLSIKAKSRAHQTFLIQLACDKGSYLPTAKAVKGGSYSAVTASGIVGPKGGRMLVDKTVQLINCMW